MHNDLVALGLVLLYPLFASPTIYGDVMSPKSHNVQRFMLVQVDVEVHIWYVTVEPYPLQDLFILIALMEWCDEYVIYQLATLEVALDTGKVKQRYMLRDVIDEYEIYWDISPS